MVPQKVYKAVWYYLWFRKYCLPNAFTVIQVLLWNFRLSLWRITVKTETKFLRPVSVHYWWLMIVLSQKKFSLNSESSKNYKTTLPLLSNRARQGSQFLFLTKFHGSDVHWVYRSGTQENIFHKVSASE